ncbi:helix-turn-helix domain-containing protein [Providencia rettgeri]|nr:helix-turn-helix transcriptional regulator [Providencia rettgeri]
MDNNQITALLPDTGSFFLRGKMTPQAGKWVSEPLWKGVKLILMMNGELECQPDNKKTVSLSGASLCIIANQHDRESQQRFLQTEDVRYVSVCLSEHLLDSFHIKQPELLLAAKHQGPQLLSKHAGNVLTALGNQILNCPLSGALGDMYLTGKILELCAHSFEHIQQSHQSIHHPKLSSHDISKLNEVNALILADLAQPPSLYQLSRLSGLNIRKLNFGFKQLFGSSIAPFIQEQRLQLAYRLLSTGAEQVSTIAWKVGYSPAHLSTAFRKRFGFSPKTLC